MLYKFILVLSVSSVYGKAKDGKSPGRAVISASYSEINFCFVTSNHFIFPYKTLTALKENILKNKE